MYLDKNGTKHGEKESNVTIAVGTPIQPYQAANKKYVDDNYVAKVTTAASNERAYIVSSDGTIQKTIAITFSNQANAQTIPRRDVGGSIYVPDVSIGRSDYNFAPGQEAVNKKYVDDAIAEVAESVNRYKHHVKFTFVSSTYNGSFFTDIYSNQNTVIDSLASLKTYLGNEFTKDLYGYLEYSNAYRLGNLITDTTVFYIQNGVGTQSISNFTISDTVTTI